MEKSVQDLQLEITALESRLVELNAETVRCKADLVDKRHSLKMMERDQAAAKWQAFISCRRGIVVPLDGTMTGDKDSKRHYQIVVVERNGRKFREVRTGIGYAYGTLDNVRAAVSHSDLSHKWKEMELVAIHVDNDPTPGEDLCLWSIWMFWSRPFSAANPDGQPSCVKFVYASQSSKEWDLKRELLDDLKKVESPLGGSYYFVVSDTCVNQVLTWGTMEHFPMSCFGGKGDAAAVDPYCDFCNAYFPDAHTVCDNCKKCLGSRLGGVTHQQDVMGASAYMDGSYPMQYTCARPGRWETRQVWVE